MTATQVSDVYTAVNDDLGPLGDARAGVAAAGARAKARIARDHRCYQPLPARQAEDSFVSFDVAPVADAAADIGRWWWGESHWWWPGHLFGLSVFDRPDGLHLRGQLDWDHGDLWFGSTGVTAVFGIGSDRLPGPGWYRSVPNVNLWGQVWGCTGVSGPFGDTWSKCRLHANQKISVAGGPMINQAHWWDTLCFESAGSHGERALPGTFTLPEIFFEVVPGRPLVVELELRFDIQLEGASAFRFGNHGGWTDTIFQSPQWSLVP
jgi:hypothetical protein